MRRSAVSVLTIVAVWMLWPATAQAAPTIALMRRQLPDAPRSGSDDNQRMGSERQEARARAERARCRRPAQARGARATAATPRYDDASVPEWSALVAMEDAVTDAHRARVPPQRR